MSSARSPLRRVLLRRRGGRPLRRVLSLWDLILYGIVLVMPIAPVPLFGLAQQLSNGHAVTTILLGMVAMGLTAVSYGKWRPSTRPPVPLTPMSA